MSVCFKLTYYLDIWICWKTHLMRNNYSYFDTGFPTFCWSFLDMEHSSDSYVNELVKIFNHLIFYELYILVKYCQKMLQTHHYTSCGKYSSYMILSLLPWCRWKWHEWVVHGAEYWPDSSERRQPATLSSAARDSGAFLPCLPTHSLQLTVPCTFSSLPRARTTFTNLASLPQ